MLPKTQKVPKRPKVLDQSARPTVVKTVYFDPTLWHDLKVESALSARTLTDVLHAAARQYLQTLRRNRAPRAV